MTEQSTTSQRNARGRVQFSIGTLMLWTAIVCLAVSHGILALQMRGLKRELESSRPLRAEEVARQFEQRTTLPPIRTTVRDVRYSSEKDSYKVDFSWHNAKNGRTWSSDVTLKSDGFGSYFGEIRNGSFVQPLGYKSPYSVVVKSPSPLVSHD